MRLTAGPIFLSGAGALVVACLAFWTGSVGAQDKPDAASIDAGREVFRTTCAPCHTVGQGKLVGPDLEGLQDRAPSRKWVVAFIKNPQNATDPYGKALREEYRDAMNPQAHLGDERIDAVIDFIYSGGPWPEKSVKTGDEAIGREYFSGKRSFEGGGPACVGCHAIGSHEELRGGTVGPDLSGAIVNAGGEEGLAGALGALGDPHEFYSGGAALTDDEVAALTGFLADASRIGEPSQRGGRYLPLVGLLLAIIGLAVADFSKLGRRADESNKPDGEAGPEQSAGQVSNEEE